MSSNNGKAMSPEESQEMKNTIKSFTTPLEENQEAAFPTEDDVQTRLNNLRDAYGVSVLHSLY